MFFFWFYVSVKSLKLVPSLADKAILSIHKSLWGQNITVDCSRTKDPLNDFKTNELKEVAVAILEKSFKRVRYGHLITSPMMFCCFLGSCIYFVFTALVFGVVLCADMFLWLFLFVPLDEKTEDLEDLYEAGLYVFAGWHEKTAHCILHKCYPNQKPQWSLAEGCKIFVFPALTPEIALNIRLVGASQNSLEVTHQKMDLADAVGACRRQHLRNLAMTPPVPRLTKEDKVFLFIFVNFSGAKTSSKLFSVEIFLWAHEKFFIAASNFFFMGP